MRVLTIGATGQFAGVVVPAFVRKGRTEIALLMSRHASREVAAVDVEPDIALDGMPDGPMRKGLTAMSGAYTADGFHGGNNLALTKCNT